MAMSIWSAKSVKTAGNEIMQAWAASPHDRITDLEHRHTWGLKKITGSILISVDGMNKEHGFTTTIWNWQLLQTCNLMQTPKLKAVEEMKPIQIYTRTKFEGLRRMDLHYMLTWARQSPSPCQWNDNSRNSPKKLLHKRCLYSTFFKE
jgi:hypothetical protein